MKILVTVIVVDTKFRKTTATLEREVEIPAPPIPGLTIFGEDWQETIDKVLYDEVKERYVAKLFQVDAHDSEECVTAMLGMGWRKT